jgi:hypothetical protein
MGLQLQAKLPIFLESGKGCAASQLIEAGNMDGKQRATSAHSTMTSRMFLVVSHEIYDSLKES